jgi:arsenate reductase (thioredoxin)
MRKKNVLFLCIGNSCRSQIGEALLRTRHGDRFEAYSAGLDPKGIHPLTLQVLEEVGIETKQLRSKRVKEYLGRLWVNYLVIVCDDAADRCPRIFPGMGQRFAWRFDDAPAFQGTDEERLQKFREVRDQIDATIETWVKELESSGQLEGFGEG